MEQLIINIKEKAFSLQSLLQDIRHHFHKYPELSFQEMQTSKKIAELLKEWEIPFQSGIAGHGIVGILKGKNPSARIIALRADMDALPIQEKNNTPYCSVHKGIMHACGHDVHMTWLLGALFILKSLKQEWEGSIKFIFQPGEEKLPGGASLMIEQGVLEHPRPQVIIGQHVQPGLESGKVQLFPGKFMASCDELYLTIHGKGGHAAIAQLCVNPIMVAADLLQAYDQFIIQEKPESVPAVLSFGKIATEGGATNVIPEQVSLEGTFRCIDEEFRSRSLKRIEAIANDVCKKHGAQAGINIIRGYPCLINDESSSKRVLELSKEYLGSENAGLTQARMTSEDFSYYSQQIPAVFYRTGIGRDVSVHNPHFDINEDCIHHGAGLMAYLAVQI